MKEWARLFVKYWWIMLGAFVIGLILGALFAPYIVR